MKKVIKGKVLGVFLVAAIILGSTAILGYVIAAAQNAADKEVVTNRIAESNAEMDYDIPVVTPTLAPYDPNAPTISPEEEAIAVSEIVIEIERVFGVDISSYDYEAFYSEYYTDSGLRGELTVAIVDNHNSYLGFYNCTLDAVYGVMIYDAAQIAKDNVSVRGESPMTGDDSYSEAAIKAMSIINRDAIIESVRFRTAGYNGTDITFWMTVSLAEGNTYEIRIAKDDRSFAGYSFIEGLLPESIFD